MVFNEGSHRYTINGKFVNGVTTMLGLLGKEGLIQWSANMAVEYIKDHSAKQDAFYPVLYATDEETLKEAKYAWMKKRDKAGDVGTAVHKCIELHIAGKQHTFAEAREYFFHNFEFTEDAQNEVNGFMEAFYSFLEWEQREQPTYLESERKIYSEKYNYAGTTDLVYMTQDGKRRVSDFKTADTDKEYNKTTKTYTGKVRARKEHFYQDALYDQAITEETGVSADEYEVIYLTKDGILHAFQTDRTNEMKATATKLVEFYKLDKEEDKENKYE